MSNAQLPGPLISPIQIFYVKMIKTLQSKGIPLLGVFALRQPKEVEIKLS